MSTKSPPPPPPLLLSPPTTPKPKDLAQRRRRDERRGNNNHHHHRRRIQSQQPPPPPQPSTPAPPPQSSLSSSISADHPIIYDKNSTRRKSERRLMRRTQSQAVVGGTRRTPANSRPKIDYSLQSNVGNLYFNPGNLSPSSSSGEGCVGQFLCPTIERRIISPRQPATTASIDEDGGGGGGGDDDDQPSQPRRGSLRLLGSKRRSKKTTTTTITAAATPLMIPHRHCSCVEPVNIRLFRDRHFSGPSLLLTKENHLTKWAEQLASSSVNNSNAGAKLLHYRSIQMSVPVLVYLFALYCDHNRIYVIPLVIPRSVGDIDLFIRRHIQYSSVYNPYGSGSYMHWVKHHIQYFIGWTVSERHILLG